jgi:uncharacterized protein (TIGR03067 family)
VQTRRVTTKPGNALDRSNGQGSNDLVPRRRLHTVPALEWSVGVLAHGACAGWDTHQFGRDEPVSRKGYLMKAMSLFLLTTGALLAADGPSKDDPSKGDLDKLRGAWLTVSLKNNGKTIVDEKTPPKEGPITKVVYDGNKWMIKVGSKTVVTGKFKIDATKTPRQIDFMDESGVKNDKTKLGIYKLDGDTYTYCLAPAGKPRPTEFTSKDGSGHSLGVSKREKP